MGKVTYEVERNKKFGDYRVVQYVNGKYENERDNNWSRNKAYQVRKAVMSGAVDFEFCDDE